MAVKLRIPLSLVKFTNKKECIEASSGIILDILIEISKKYPKLASRIMGKEGKLKGYIKLFLEGESPGFIDNMNTKIKDGEIIRLIMAIGGG